MSDHPIAARWRSIRAEVRAGQRAALIPYLTAGFPTPALSLEALRTVAAAGADFVEVGVPFSDPLADGITIQRSTQAALEQGMSVPRVLDQIARAALSVPVVIMTYVNPVLAYGPARFLADAAAAGAAGLLLTDVPAGADAALEAAVLASPLALIRLVAPTTPPERLTGAQGDPRGFVYLISRLGVTGASAALPADLPQHVARVRRATSLPLAVGFGISTAEQVRAAARLADGVVVGSAFVATLGADGLGGVERLARAFAQAVRDAAAAPGGPSAPDAPTLGRERSGARARAAARHPTTGKGAGKGKGGR